MRRSKPAAARIRRRRARLAAAAAVLMPAAAAAAAIAIPAAPRAAEPPEAARTLFPPASRLAPAPLNLSGDRIDAVEDAAGVRVRPRRIRIWRAEDQGSPAGWLFIDQVIGKHEFITYALAVREDGAVSGFRILEYLESYGGEVQRESWRAQFYGKSLANSRLVFGRDIDNISGATLSSRNLTDGIRKLLLLREALMGASGR